MSTNPEALPASGLKLQVSKEGDSAVVTCTGRLTMGAAANFKSHVKTLVKESRRVVVDLSGVTYMDSSGLGAIVGVYVTAKTAKCELQLIKFNQQIRQLFAFTNMLTLFETCGEQNVRLP
jgi:anti-sigma B factor antagonist